MSAGARVRLDGVWFGPLCGATFFVEGGQTVVLSEHEVGAAWIQLTLGLASPRLGRVSVLDGDPRTRPDLRRRVVGLAATEHLPPAASVVGALATLLRLRGSSTRAEAALEALSLDPLAHAAPEDLGPGERRGVALALALADERAEVLLLFEPLSDVAGADRGAIRAGMARARERGATIVVATGDTGTALSLGGERMLLGARPLPGADPPALAWYVECDDAAVLARALLVTHPELRVAVSERGLTVRSEALDVPRAVLGAVRETGARFRALGPLSPPVSVLLAETRRGGA